MAELPGVSGYYYPPKSWHRVQSLANGSPRPGSGGRHLRDHAVQGVQHLPVQKLCLFEITLNTTRHLLELHVHAVDPVGKAWQPKALLDRPGRPLGLQVGREPHKVRFQSHQSVQDFVSGIANSAL